MRVGREHISVAIAYLIVILYVILQNNPIVSSVLIALLFVYQVAIYIQVTKKLSVDKETSLSKLEFRLAKTKRKQEESYKRFISLSYSFGSGLIMVDEDGIIQLANKDFMSYFPGEYTNRDYKVLSPIKRLYKFVNQAYLLEETTREQIQHNERVYDLISTPLFEDNMFKGTLILCHDITLIQNAEKYQKRFTADVSHELRTPLSAIKGFSEILSRDTKIDPKERQEFIGLIQKESARMEYILNDLMIISRMDRLDYELEFSKQDISLVYQECYSVLKTHFETKGLGHFVEMESKSMYIDKQKLSQVFINIVKNAINYTDKGHISVKGYLEMNNYVIKISDTGIGIKEKDYEKIFKRFYRVDKARSRDSGGSGLGLSISKNVVLKHGGTISVDSELNKGTTFTIKLPIKE